MRLAKARRAVVIATLTFAHAAAGLNVFLVGKVVPLVAETFAVPLSAVASVIFAQQSGLVVGAIGSGIFAAHAGRRRLVTACLLVAGLLGIAVASVDSLAGFSVLRLLVGICLGLATPALIAEATSQAPLRWRSVALTTVLAGNLLGAGSGFVLVGRLNSGADWRSVFVIAGLILIVAAGLLHAPRRDSDPPPADGLRLKPQPLIAIFTREHRFVSLWLGLAFMTSMTLNAILAAWFATYFHNIGGISAQQFARVGVVAIPGSVIGMLAIGVAARDLPRPLLIATVFGGHGTALVLLGSLPFASPSFIAAFAAVAALQAAGQGLLNVTLVERYADALRTTALGGAAAIGRIGGLAAPWLGVMILDIRPTLAELFLALALVPLLVGAMLAATRVNRPRDRQL